MAYTTIDDPEAYFQVELWTGTGSSFSLTFDGDTNMQPDMVWKKERSGTENHTLTDVIRGNSLYLQPSGITSDGTTTEGIKSFDSDGFTIGTDDDVNTNTETYVAWCWKAGGSGGAQTDGDIDTVRSTNTTSLFTIATYEASGTNGNTLGHGLGVTPGLYWIKNREGAGEDAWRVYHHNNTAAPETDFLILNTTAATADNAGFTNDVAPTTSLISLGDDEEVNTDGEDYMLYAWGEVQGFSKFGNYTGNGNADGQFVFLGFRPATVIFKVTSTTGSWLIVDNKRDPHNVANHILIPSGSDAAITGNSSLYVDFLSNGFKIRGTNSSWNTNTATYIYAAWAEAPFVNSNGVPCNAR